MMSYYTTMFHRLSFLVCDRTGAGSTAKIWRHIAFGVITYKVSMMSDITYEMLLAYATVAAGVELGQQLIKPNKEVKNDK